LTGTLTHPTPTHFTNDGERDMATSPPSQFLLFRNLETGVNEEILSKGVLKLTLPNCPGGAEASSIKRVLLVRDRRTNESWRFGFAEFSTPQDAQKAFKSYEKVEKFTISSKPVTLSYIHPGVFVPVYNALEEAHRFTFLPLTPVGGGMRLAYWDEEGYVSELVLSDKEKSSNSGAEEKNNPPAGSGEKKSKKRKAENASGTDKSATASKKATSIPAHLQFWQNRHTELHGGVPATKSDRPEPGAEVGESSTDGHEATTGGVKGFSTPETGSQNESFADKNKLACLLCSRVFKSVEKLKHHERDSTLHATNLKDPALCEAARKKLPKNHLVSEYRDRARERRAVFGSSTAQAPSGNSQKKKQFMPKAEEEPDSVVEPMPNKGAALLGKMGWSHGQGLGATGAGTTQHVVVDMYTAGAGLGMKGAKIGDVEEVSRASAGGYQEFVRKTKERAKERYEEMG
jgi:RNA-binding protein 5/10